MKKLFSALAIAALALTTTAATAQKNEDKSKRASPPAVASATISSGAKITIDYSQPSVKGRTIGKDLEPMEGEVWRAGANEATVFQTSKDITVEGKKLPAGKYAFFTVKKGDTWTLIFNKTWKTWGAYDYEKNKGNDALTVDVQGTQATTAAEKLTFNVAKNGTVSLLWGPEKVTFNVK
jgi:hypothetical protein